MQFPWPRLSKWHLGLSSGPATAQLGSLPLPAPQFRAYSASALTVPAPCCHQLPTPEGRAGVSDFFQQEFSSQTPPGGLSPPETPNYLSKWRSPCAGKGAARNSPSLPPRCGREAVGAQPRGPALHLLQVSKGKKTKMCKPWDWSWDPGLPAFTARAAGSSAPWIAASLCCKSGHCREAAHGKRARQRAERAVNSHPQLCSRWDPAQPPPGCGTWQGHTRSGSFCPWSFPVHGR